jgi:hypothetical protein
MTNLIKTQTQFVDGPNDNSLTLFLDQSNVLNVKDACQNFNPIACYTGGGGGGGGTIADSEGLLSSARICVGNTAFGDYGSALSGFTNITCNDFTANTWGRNSCAIGCYSSVSGTSNIVVARNSHILSGTNNTIACDATQGGWNTQSSYSGNYINQINLPDGGGISCGRVGNNVDLTSVWNAGDTFSATYSYAYGVTGTGSASSQIQMVNVPIICSEFVAPYTYLYFCYDPTSPSFIGTYRCECGTGSTYSNGYIQKTGTFSSYSTYGATYHPNTIAGGAFNVINGYTSGATISGGYQNTLSGGYATIGGGFYNYIENTARGFIGSGAGNKLVNGNGSFIGAGNNNNICTSGYSSITSGNSNNINCSGNSIIVGGTQNNICTLSSYVIIGGGRLNSINTNSQYSGIFGGRSNTITNFTDTFIVGSSIIADRSCATFVNNLSIKNIPTSDAGLPSGSVWLDSATCTLKLVP